MSAAEQAGTIDQVDTEGNSAPFAAWAGTRADLVAFVARRVEDRDSAEDIVQDVLVRMINADIATIENPHAWLYRSARNAIIDHYRKRRPSTGAEDAIAELPDFHNDNDTTNDEPSQPVQELARCLGPMITQLPKEYRSALTLVDLEGHTQQAAAELSGLSTPGLKSRVQRGRRKLAALLQECCAVETDRTGAIIDYEPRADPCSCA